ncbi:hypothetical protein [Janthinobacterium fluminis]|uniref:Uncharacterized protein n=1 Tax=Janthinobacterium fluminis TaxID=2987524 RepID=A0ABT5K1P8_9BURK|nr:hypothetical protein [Janthinobacterium fluminis]MDC8758216.1 hypothetical protein [Janthinobacterium fluminis]
MNEMILQKLKLSVLGVLLLSGAASARPIHDITMYRPVATGGSYAAQVTYNGNASTVAVSDMANGGAPMAQLVGGASNFYWSIRTKLSEGIAAGIAAAGQDASVDGPGGLWGDLNMSVSGLPDGSLRMAMSGLSFNINITARKSNWLGSVTCRSQVTLNSISFSSQYNPYNGAVAGTVIDFTPTQSTSCDSSFSWIPFLGDFIDRKASSMLGSAMLSKLSSLAGQVLPVAPQQAFFGFSNAIQPNEYMIGSFDAGMYVKNNLQSLYVGKTISLFIANDYKYEPGNRNQPGPASAGGTSLALNFSDANGQVGFAVNANKNYTWVKYIIPGTNGPGDGEEGFKNAASLPKR